MRYVYVLTIPVLATLLLGLIFFAPGDRGSAPWRAAAGTVLAVTLGYLGFALFEHACAQMGLGTISPRPFMTRFVNLLVVEPQDNSFPCPELIVAAALSTGLWALKPKIGLASAGAVLLLGFARLFCGTNYPVDVLLGAVLGYAWGCLALAAVRVPLGWNFRPHALPNRLTLQCCAGFTSLALCVLGIYGGLASSGRFEGKIKPLWGSPAKAAPAHDAARAAEDSHRGASPRVSSAARSSLQEGEGGTLAAANSDDPEALSLQKRSNLFLPEVEKRLKSVLSPTAAPFRLKAVEAAPVKAGNSEYRCIALRVDLGTPGKIQRGQVFEVARRLTLATFAADGQVQNVEFTGVIHGDGKYWDQSDVVFIGNEIPVFTSSIQRANLNRPRPEAGPGLDAHGWLKGRSLLYINSRAIPGRQPITHSSGSAAGSAAHAAAPLAPTPATPGPAGPVPGATAPAVPAHPAATPAPALTPAPSATPHLPQVQQTPPTVSAPPQPKAAPAKPRPRPKAKPKARTVAPAPKPAKLPSKAGTSGPAAAPAPAPAETGATPTGPSLSGAPTVAPPPASTGSAPVVPHREPAAPEPRSVAPRPAPVAKPAPAPPVTAPAPAPAAPAPAAPATPEKE